MTGSHGSHGGRRSTVVAFALYSVFLVTAQFEHHDFACHLKIPQHCTSCAASALGSDPRALGSSPTCILSDSGRLVVFHSLPECALLTIQSPGRSPPSDL